jgi:prevent-host-death family protein
LRAGCTPVSKVIELLSKSQIGQFGQLAPISDNRRLRQETFMLEVPPRFRNRLGQLIDLPVVTASRFKSEFGTVFEQAAVGGAVAITKHDTPKAVLLSFDEFQALVAARSPRLDTLGDEFDALLARMQTPAARQGLNDAFDASPDELGRAAVAAAQPIVDAVVASPRPAAPATRPESRHLAGVARPPRRAKAA